MLAGFLDESYTNDGSRIYVVSGILYDRRDVRSLNRRWRKQLRTAGLRRFHTVEQAHLRGEFEGRPRVEADDIYQQFLRMLRFRTRGSVTVCAFPESGFDILSPGAIPLTPYAMSAYACMSRILLLAREEDEKVTFFIEDGADGARELSRLIRNQKARNDEVWTPNLETWQFVQKDAVPAIQAADILAYEISKRVHDLTTGQVKGSTRPLRKSLDSILGEDDRHKLEVLDQRLSKRFLGTLGIK